MTKIEKLQEQINSGKLPENIKQNFIEKIKFLKSQNIQYPQLAWLCYNNNKHKINILSYQNGIYNFKLIEERLYSLESNDKVCEIIPIL